MAVRPKFSATLNAARFAVGLSVTLVHFLPLPLVALGAPPAIFQLLNTRNLTSSFFFLLSGFIVAMTALREDRQEAPFRFFIKRLSRLWPAHAAAFLLMVPAAALTAGGDTFRGFLADAVAWITMTHGFFPSMSMLYNGPAWAVTSFALGYAAVPYLVRCRDWPLPRLAMLAGAVWLVPAGAQAALLWSYSGVWDAQVVPRAAMTGEGEWLQRFLHSSPLFRVPEVLCGAAGALIARRVRIRATWLAPAVAVGLYFGGGLDDRWLFMLTHGALTPLLLIMLSTFWHTGGWIERLCATAWLRKGGQSGILIYFLHRPVFRFLAAAYRLLSGASVGDCERSIWLALAATAATVALAFWIQPAYDRACKRLAAALLSDPATPAPRSEVAACAR
jgi:peptidoglycan/LPS O-acetylase OafA/YrhL